MKNADFRQKLNMLELTFWHVTCLSIAAEGELTYSNLTPLFDAVHSGDLDFIVNYFSNDTADPNARMVGEDGANLITFACLASQATAEPHDLNHVCEKQLEIVKFLIAKGADVNSCCSVFGAIPPNCSISVITPIYAAVKVSNEPLVRMLLDHGADPSSKTSPYKLAPLHLAAFLDSPDICEMLLRSGADINQRDVDGNTPLILACVTGHSNVSYVILKWSDSSGVKVDVNARTRTRRITALHAAVIGGNLETVELLLLYGASVNAKTTEGHTALDMAIFTGNEKLRKLLDRGETSTFNAKKGKGPKPLQSYLLPVYGYPNPLLISAAGNFLEDMKYLVERGCDVNAKDLQGRSPLFHAVTEGHVKAVQFLINAKAEVNVEPVHGLTPLNVAALAGFEQIVALLLKHGAKLIDLRPSCVPILFSAAEVPDIPESEVKKKLMVRKAKITEKLIHEGAPIDEEYSGSTPLKYARKVGNGPVMAVINRQIQLFRSIDQQNLTELRACLKSGALPNCRSVRYGTPLLYAVVRNNLNLVSSLIEHGANVNLNPPGRDSALHYAAKRNFHAVARKLLASGAAFDARSEASGGKTPLEVCVDEGCETAVLLKFVQGLFDLTQAMDSVSLNDVRNLIVRARNPNGASVDDVCRAARDVENVPRN